MAVIQDLPPELLRRILELLVSDRRVLKDLYNATLVARAWRHPSQSLLLYHMHLQRLKLPLCTEALCSNSGCTLRLVDVNWHNAWVILRAPREHDVSVETLDLFATRRSDLDLSTLSLKLLASAFCAIRRQRSSLTAPHTLGLKSLRLGGDFEGHPIIPPDTKLELTQLTLDAHYLPSLAFLDSILPAAPFLTSLELWVGRNGELLPTEYTAPFQTISHQLRHLAISSGLRFRLPTTRASLDVTRFVASCTSLKSLAVRVCGTAYIRDVAAAASAHLCVLETQVTAGWDEGENQIAELISVLELPAMAKLKRWRMYKCDFNGVLLDQEARARWNAACRARGVEPRDHTLFFTDYPLE
uniref:F-box domain-containing protein n=1 Tax=Leucosporidium scottii TaxID=5278 RepID=A0A0H5FSU4_9BASI|nr:hypothetical protein [Leucosporidium scottii]